MNQKTENCRCNTVEQLASDRRFPIEYDEQLNEYNLVSGDENVSYRLYFCFFCGGRLAESKRDRLFTEPSAEERKEVEKLLGKITSIQQATQLLGKPDKRVRAPKASSRQNGQAVAYRWHHQYLTRWKTLDLTIREREDGSFDSAFTGKYQGVGESENRQ